MTKKKTKGKIIKSSPIIEEITSKEVVTKQRVQTFKGDLLRKEYDEVYLKRNGLYDKTIKRKMRYWCFKLMHATVDEKDMPDAPKGLKKFVEDLPGFAGWENFAKTWDIQGNNPFVVVLRLQSVWTEWDHVMDRVAIPIDSPPEQINARMETLARDYAKNNR